MVVGICKSSLPAGGNCELASVRNACRLIVALAVASTLMHSAFAAKRRHCADDRLRCPIEINLREDGNGVVVRGRLSHRRMVYSYRFFSKKDRIFTWKFRGPAVRELIAYPDGQVDGPGLPMEIPLKQQGNYVFSVASNTMAEKIFGPFALQLTLKKVPVPR
jgi:hypothetical protein